MFDTYKMYMASNMFLAAVQGVGGLTDEEIMRVMVTTFPRAMRRAFEEYDKLVRKENKMNYTDEKIDLLANMLKEIANVEITKEDLEDIKAKTRDKNIEAKVKDEKPWVEKELDPFGDNWSAKRIIDEREYTEVYEVTDMDENVECNCGMEVYAFSKEQLEGMLSGKVYWTDCNAGEYAHLFVMRKDSE